MTLVYYFHLSPKEVFAMELWQLEWWDSELTKMAEEQQRLQKEAENNG